MASDHTDFGRIHHHIGSEAGKARLDNLYDMLDDFSTRPGKCSINFEARDATGK